MVAITESKVGKFTFTVQKSKESGPKVQDRIEAIANWLLKQWEERNNYEQIRKNYDCLKRV